MLGWNSIESIEAFLIVKEDVVRIGDTCCFVKIRDHKSDMGVFSDSS